MRIRNVVLALLLVCAGQLLVAQTGLPSLADIDRRTDAVLKQMSLEEKISYIGGVDTFFTRTRSTMWI